MDDISSSVWGGLLPKRETQALDFISRHGCFDGRGVVVGIMDTGVDPGAVGMQTTSDGRPKVIDVIDCSGSGDVKMYGPEVAEVGSDGVPVLRAKSGRSLRLNPSWPNPSGEWFLGSKMAFELYPVTLEKRVRAARRDEWMKRHRQCEMIAIRDAAALDSSKAEADEQTARVDQLKALEEASDKDHGPVLDCVLFFDGDRWQACVDTAARGDVSHKECMTDYKVRQQFARISEEDAMNYAVNIFAGEGGEGRHAHTLSIVVDAGAHGTHVAGIVAANHLDQPERNGVAPGAQIVSLKIGDSHLGSMETGTAMVRALIAAVNSGCHILNMSYGEAVAVPNDGAFIRLLESVVNDYGILFVSSAGNNGPALSTVGAPGGTSSCAISVAAFATQSLMRTAYSMTEAVSATNYTWSSVGPTPDGHSGVSLMAPGGAVTCVSNWTLDKSMLMNGLMASPNMRTHHSLYARVPVSPHRLKHALFNSCKFVSGVNALGQGHGLIQVVAAWDHLNEHAAVSALDYALNVTVQSSSFRRGIYLRHPSEVSKRETYKVTVDPIFPELASSDAKLNFELKLRLSCPDQWVTCPDYLILAKSGKTFSIEVDPRALPEGMHVSSVQGSLDDHPEAGFIFQVPITVLKPQIVSGFDAYGPRDDMDNSMSLGTLSLEQGERLRKFLVPPLGCTYIDAIISDSRHAPLEGAESTSAAPDEKETSVSGDASSRLLAVHAVQLMQGSSYSKHEKQAYLNLLPGSRHVLSWPVIGGCPMELVFARNWSSVGDSNVNCNVTVHFCGAVPEPSCLAIQGGSCVSEQVRVTSHLAMVDCLPAGKLEKIVTAIKPFCPGKVRPMGPRDVMPNGHPIYGVDIEYCFDQVETSNVKPTWPGLNRILYESAYIAQFYFVIDATERRVVASGDAWPKSAKLNKGRYLVRLHVRADNAEMLKVLGDLQLLLERDLTKSIALSFFKTQTGAMSGTEKATATTLKPGTSTVYYVKEPSADQLPKFACPGDWLTGTTTYLKKASGHAGAGSRPGGFPVTYTVSSSVKSPILPVITASDNLFTTSKIIEVDADALLIKEASGIKAAEQAAERMAQEFSSAMKTAKVSFLKGLVGKPSFLPLSVDLSTEDSTMTDFLPFQLVLLAHAEMEVKASATKQSLETVIAVADKCASLIDTTAIALNLGRLVNKDDDVAVKARKDIEAKKSELVNALFSKACALLQLRQYEEETSGPAFDICFNEMKKWDDLSGSRFAKIHLAILKDKKRYGLMVKQIRTMLSTPSTESTDGSLSTIDLNTMLDECSRELGWFHVCDSIAAAKAALVAMPSQR